jgi:hypothetical protein
VTGSWGLLLTLVIWNNQDWGLDLAHLWPQGERALQTFGRQLFHSLITEEVTKKIKTSKTIFKKYPSCLFYFPFPFTTQLFDIPMKCQAADM